MDKNYSTTYTTVRPCQVNDIKIDYNNDNEYSMGVVFCSANFSQSNGIRSNVPHLTPSGLVSIPKSLSKALAINLGIGQSQYGIIGYMYNSLDDRVKIENEEEICIFSNNYYINLLNEALKVEFNSVDPQECQLPIGEATQQIFKDILNEILNTLKPYINNQIAQNFNTFSSTFNTHTHFIPGAMGGGGGLNTSATTSTAPTVTNYAPSAPIQTDYDYVNANKLLISETGQTNI